MPDFGAPVAQNVNVNPQQGIQTISGLLQLKQQAQSLQTGQALQQTAQAEAQKNQQMMRERQSIQAMMQSGKDDLGNDIRKPTGEPDPAKIIPALGRMAPLTGQGVAQSILQTETNKVGLQSASTTLDAAQRKLLQGPIQAAALDPEISSSATVGASIDNLVKAHPEMANAAGFVKGLLAHVDGKDPSTKAHLFNSLSAMLQGGTEVETQPKAATVDVGPVVQTGTTAPPLAGGGFTQSGSITKGLAPTETPGYKAAAARAAVTGGGTGNIDVDRATLISGSQQPASASIKLTQRVDQLSHEVANSIAAQKITQGLHALGFSSVAAARTELQKDLGLLKGPVAARAGSDSRAAELLEGYPTDTTPENTVHSAMDYIRGTMRQTLARGQLLKKHGVTGIQSADDELTRGTDPLMHEAASLKPGQSNGFYKRNFKSPEEAQQFKNRVEALKKHTNFLEAGE